MKNNGKFLKMASDYLDGKGVDWPESVKEINDFVIFAMKHLNIPDLVQDAIYEIVDRYGTLSCEKEEAIKRIASLERNCFHG